MSKHFLIVALALLASGRTNAAESKPISHASLKANPGAIIALKDKRTGVTAYVESDGRHLAGISNEGNLLWIREVIGKDETCIGSPFIRRLTFMKDTLSVTYCKHSWLEVDIKSGKVITGGSD